MENYKVLFSIPVHEKAEVVIEQLINFLHYNTDSAIILHISQSFNFKDSMISEEEFLSIVKKIGKVFVNPNRLETQWGDIIHCHISNFKYAKKCVGFEYFYMAASNELFVKSGMTEYVYNFDAIVDAHIFNEQSQWNHAQKALNDWSLSRMMHKMAAVNYYNGQIEGSVYSKKIYDEMIEIIDSCYDYRQKKEIYPREEVYFPTIISNFEYEVTIGKPNVAKADVKKYLKVLWCDVFNIRKMNSQYYSVKGIERLINDPLRSYIGLTAGYRMDVNNILEYEIDTQKLLIVIMLFFREIKTLYDICWRKIYQLIKNSFNFFHGLFVK